MFENFFIDFFNKYKGGHNFLHIVTPEEICIYEGELSNGKSCGINCIPVEFFENSPVRVFKFLSCFVSGVICRSHVPRLLTDTFLKPVVKNRQEDPTYNRNYKPLAVANSASKFIEKVIFSRIERYLGTSSNQFGFKKSHSTGQCIYALKETINYYFSLKTQVFACF